VRQRGRMAGAGRLTLDRFGPVGLPALVIVGVIVAVAQVAHQINMPTDGWLYWHLDLSSLYGPRWVGGVDPYPYPPPFAILLAQFRALPFEAFVVVWTPLLFAALWYVGRRWAFLALAAGLCYLAFPGVVPKPAASVLGWIMLGNVQLLVAAAVVVGIRWPAAWSIVLLTKIGPGVGLLWFVARGEWRSLLVALGATATIAIGTFAVWPGLWVAWFTMIRASLGIESQVPLVAVSFPIRVAMSAALIVWGARTDRVWTVPIGSGWALPALYEWSFLPFWLAAVPLVGVNRATVARFFRLTEAVACYRCGWTARARAHRPARWPACPGCGRAVGIDRRTSQRGPMLGRRMLDGQAEPATA